jgi:hypothetical protein
MGYRKITVEGKEYQYVIGKSATKIKGIAVVNNCVIGTPISEDKYAVTPACVAEYIRTGTVVHTEERKTKTKDEIAAARMSGIANSQDDDLELSHINADNLLCEILREHGYNKLVTSFNNLNKWYA